MSVRRDRVLALDVGNRRIGVAVSDELGMLARPLETIDRRKEDAAAKIAELVRECGAARVIVGLPRNMDGSEGVQARRTREFVSTLQARLSGVAVDFWDERLTTRQARDVSLQTRSKRQRQEQTLDALSACFILQSYLDFIRRSVDKPPAQS